jgi:acetyl-CoA carboxylase biotin carboxyl carrier protein
MLKVQEIREVIRLVDQSTINEFTYEQDGASISIKKSATQPVVEQPVASKVNKEEAVVEAPVKTEQVPAAEPAVEKPIVQKQEETTTDENLHEIVSPMVGTFYSKPSPESDHFVKAGDKVSGDSIVCIVEAMKLFNEIEAEVSGEIVEILVNDGELVEYGQALFKVKTQ